ncbi:MAG: GTP 3',8-cyclase MoaA [Bacteroidetes bacterium]|nr:GTP 3',8-cyclase MoaA [Bacteroidota bacterium]
MLTDNHGRKINYLRLAVTDRCNLRCSYCMPEEGIQWLERKELLSFDEMLRTCNMLVTAGIEKIRITGGEPFARKGIMSFISDLAKLDGLKELTITTNGVVTAPLIPELKALGIKSINLSLDTLDRDRFYAITFRDELPAVLNTIDTALAHDIHLKLNAVVMNGKNTEDILPLVALTKDLPIDVRFIEEMPFNGDGHTGQEIFWDYKRILDHIKTQYPAIAKIQDPPYSTSYNYQIPGHKGSIGIIAAYTRLFCGTCNRIRITPQGTLKTCLYDNGVLNIKSLLRDETLNDTTIVSAIQNAIAHKPKDGHEAERIRDVSNPVHESMATIGG